MAREINFIAMGDSLTVGFIPQRLGTQPYSDFLQEYADSFLKELGKKGKEQITSRIKERIKRW